MCEDGDISPSRRFDIRTVNTGNQASTHLELRLREGVFLVLVLVLLSKARSDECVRGENACDSRKEESAPRPQRSRSLRLRLSAMAHSHVQGYTMCLCQA